LTGIDTFTYEAQDAFGDMDNATVDLIVDAGSSGGAGFYFPPRGESLDAQDLRTPEEVGLHANIMNALSDTGERWALWRHGYLVHVKGDFNATAEVKSLRKTIHALTVGAAVRQGKIPSYNQQINVWQTELSGNDAKATWWHVLTQSAGFDYPGCNDSTDYEPGDIWTYSDMNLYHLCQALSKVYGKTSYYDNYNDVVQEAIFGAIGLEGWSTTTRSDGIRFVFDLEDMGRLGLLILARGTWNGTEVIPQQFIEELERKQTYGMQVNYNGCHNGDVCLTPDIFPEVPYGYLTWVNTDGDYFPGADTGWAWAWGAGGKILMWNYSNGIVFAASNVHDRNYCPPVYDTIPHIIDAHVSGPNPLANEPPLEGYIIDNGGPGTSSTGKWKVSGGATPYGVDSVYSKVAGDTYIFEADAGGALDVFLWWTQHSSRCASVRVEISDVNGVLDVLSINQRADEGRWNYKGSYAFGQSARVTIFSPGGCSASADAVRFTGPELSSLPIAEFSAHPTDCTAPCNVDFTDLSSGEITTWGWDFDNDTVIDSNIQHPSHIYDAPGIYTVVLSVSGPDGSEAITKKDYITVKDPNIPPPEEYIIDNGGPGTSSTGEWKVSGGANPYGVDSVYSKVAGDTYTFEADAGGALDVFLWWTQHSTRCASVRVEMSDVNGVLDVLSINQQADEGQWNDKGSYVFGQSARVTIFSPGGCSANADAVRFNTSMP
jgi:PKD repeat protein/CubicO group peptidase (beta-lactamase class C family)